MPPLGSSFAQSNLSLLIMTAKRQIKQLGTAGLKRFRLTDQQCLLLETLREVGPVCLSDLATELRLDHPTASRLVHTLEERALLKVRLDPKHRRRVLIHLDEDNQTFLDELHHIVQTYRSRLEAGLTEEEKSTLRACLGKLVTNLDTMEQDLLAGRIGSVGQPLA
ncbi:MarR family winged helix-turn-helix transcriptional regulator [Holophaga foetida]|uniref:MarR family winged helix-turn-helix transcriptional regulator n=1 Tax=Holophaga foetida TaxID=35839 RepID=UPI0002472162|nr:MarR family transcriptional regulator [Holophaga foetida]